MTFYDDSHVELQEHFDSRDLATAMEFSIVQPQLDERAIAFIENREFFFLSTVRADGQPTVSHKGGPKGFVRVLDSTTLVFPSYDGNGMFLSMGNIHAGGARPAKIGMLFIDFETPHRVRIHADATINVDDPLIDEFPGAQLLVRATVTDSFINCPRYIVKHQRVEASKYVPDENGDAPTASWKHVDAMRPFLRPDDQIRVAEEGVSITLDEYVDRVDAGEA